MEARKLCFSGTFLFFITTKGSCWHITIGDGKASKTLGRLEKSWL